MAIRSTMAVMAVAMAVAACHSADVIHRPSADREGCAWAIPFSGDDFTFDGALPDLYGAVYFSVALTPERPWVRLETNAVESGADPVISVLDETGGLLLAQVDDSFIVDSVHPGFHFHAPSPGTFCIKVESWEAWIGSSVQPADPPLNVSFCGQVMPTAASAFDGAEGPVALVPVDAGNGSSFIRVNGTLAAGEPDRFTFDGVEQLVEVVADMATGTGDASRSASGSGTTATVRVRIDSGGATLSDLSFENGNRRLLARLPGDGPHQLVVEEAPSHVVGTNDFYSLAVFLVDDPGLSEPVDDNDSPATAGLLPLREDDGYRTGTLLGELSPDGDVDVFRFEADPGDTLELLCAAGAIGSSIDGFAVRLLNAAGDVAREDVENERAVYWSLSADATLSPVWFTDGGSWHLSLSGSPDDRATGRLYSCSVALYR